jgi:hypothetical protein
VSVTDRVIVVVAPSVPIAVARPSQQYLSSVKYSAEMTGDGPDPAIDWPASVSDADPPRSSGSREVRDMTEPLW